MTDDSKEELGVSAQSPVEEPHSIFTTFQKGIILTIVAVAGSFSAFSSNIYFTAIPSIADNLHVTPEKVNLTVTTYLIFQGLSPSIWGAVADVHGRRVTYIITFIIYLGACIGLAKTEHYYQLVILRCLQSTGSASTIAIGAGVVGDITTREARGGYMGIYQAGVVGPAAIGPVLGGIFAQTLGWRAIFWFLTIFSGIVLVILFFVLPETLRSLVGNGSLPAKGVARSPLAYIQRHRTSKTAVDISITAPTPNKKTSVNVLGPLRLIFGLESTYIIFFFAVIYSSWQVIMTVMSTLFQKTYGLTELQTGLTFIANGTGAVIGTIATGKFLDFDYRRFKARYTGAPEDFPLEHSRLRMIWLWGSMQGAAILVFGWTLQYQVHISVPIICTMFLGWTSTSVVSTVSTFMVDVYPNQSASATAALNFVRCLMAAGATAGALPVVNAIGAGWTFTLVSFILWASFLLVALQLGPGAKKRKAREAREKAGTDE